jgi:hypothetical protein
MKRAAIAASVLVAALTTPVVLAHPAAAASPSPASCEDGSRDSAKAVADTKDFVESRDAGNANPGIDVVLRYSQTYECAWGLISGHDGDHVWVDRWIDGEPTWQPKRGDRAIRSGNGSTYTEAVRTGGAAVRACGQPKTGGIIECTPWVPKLPVGPSAVTPPQAAEPSPPSTGPTKPVGDVFAASTDVPCAPGTTDAGTADGWHSMTSVKIRLCSVNSLPSSGEEDGGHARVNSRVSGAVVALVAAAKDAGVTLTATSSFRSMAQQQTLCARNKACANGNYAAVAPPGTSNHQMGVAIDFAGPSTKNLTATTCSARATDPSDETWAWLKDHASTFGFRQYAVESWHWDPLTTANRC